MVSVPCRRVRTTSKGEMMKQRRQFVWGAAMSATLAIAAFAADGIAVSAAAASPYPAILVMHHGLSQSGDSGGSPWGTKLTAAQAREVKVKSVGPTFRWGVWYKYPASQFPVRSSDSGAHWTAAGPQLASDWAGGSLFYVTKVISESPTSVVGNVKSIWPHRAHLKWPHPGRNRIS